MENARTLAAAAAWYASHKIPVFPIKPRDKVPLTRHGFKAATTDQARITSWWRKWPDANIGVPTGAVSGLLAVDIDPRNGGNDSVDQLRAKHGGFPETAEQITGGGGRHIVLRYAGGSVPKALAPGIDLKGDGGYIVVAPSIHANGSPYEWDGIEGENALLKPADAPAWLLESIAGQRSDARATDGEKWRPGERNNRLTSLGGKLRCHGQPRGAIEAELLKENHRRCDPPLESSEVRRIARSVARYPADVAALEGNRRAFTPPGYASVSEAFLDVVRFTADLPEFPVLLFHVERSLAYGKRSDCTSLSQMVEGVLSKKRKTWIRKGCGLGKAAVVKANKALARRQLLLIRRRSSPALGNEATEYEVNWPVLSRYLAERKQQPVPTLVSLRDKPLVSLRDTHNHYQGGEARPQVEANPMKAAEFQENGGNRYGSVSRNLKRLRRTMRTPSCRGCRTRASNRKRAAC